MRRYSLSYLLAEVSLAGIGLGLWRIAKPLGYEGLILYVVAMAFICAAIWGVFGGKGMLGGALFGIVVSTIHVLFILSAASG